MANNEMILLVAPRSFSIFFNCINFEIVRVSYLLANKKAVICVKDKNDVEIEEDLLHGTLKFVTSQDCWSAYLALVDDNNGREQYAEKGYEVFKRRDIREVISRFFV